MSLRSRALPRLLALAAAAAACAHGPSPKQREASDIHYQLGAEALSQNRRADALREFEQAIEANPENANAWLGRGIVRQFFGKTEEAERDFRRSLELAATPSAHNALGQLLAATGRLEQAVSEFDKALEDMTWRDAYLARCNRGQALHELGRKEDGIADLRACVAAAPRWCQAHRELGRAQLADGRVKEALEAFQRYTELCEKLPDAWFQLGLAQMKAGEPEAARDAFDRCRSVAGEDALGEECRRRAGALQ
ncbi:MAG TPA: tetratricopeptide repeat protein [Anaeromyxobacteraceae bacterium]|nr:tetratricopeptide repeat protein [Anaeromyxobacteraceae bacterium]